MSYKNYFRLFQTVRHLKIKQVAFQLFYRLRKTIFPLRFHSVTGNRSHEIKLKSFIPSYPSFNDYSFTFLNLEKKMIKGKVNWDDEVYGKLWTYNLNYFDFLLQNGMDKEVALELINNYISDINIRTNGLEPYPISLRGINWIKFLSFNSIKDQNIDDSLFSQYVYLSRQIEFHLLGNHLLENSFSLLFGAYYFQDYIFYKIAKKIITKELQEQILEDGSHFELSPMYHQIMLQRVLDCYNLVNNSPWQNKELMTLLGNTAAKMLSWLENITFSNGSVPMVNDSSFGIAPTTIELMKYASDLGVDSNNLPLSESGYRKIRKDNWELFIDVGNIGPDYIPGHAHSDTFNFLLHINKNPFIVEVGTSTYENSEKRLIERSTESHNTVKINKKNQSEIWSSFRVAERAKIKELVESENIISAIHDGYKKYGIYHKRTFSWEQSKIIIVDEILSKTNHNCEAYIHLYPGINAEIVDNMIITDLGKISIDGSKEIKIDEYERSAGFNKLETGKVIIIYFENKLETRIIL